ncbi:putative conserved secreted protein [Fasciolopsis buskii]|uniref:Putative conserved secreted protein n=1 Tax=Fasciolopsis buskii TaxID=27845 RepID=A0A8E0RUM8_9TREM|nr:putative conserved secreted protein [Fasciolopsis buski]
MLVFVPLVVFSFICGTVVSISIHDVVLPTKCEACRVLVHELLLRLNETQSSDTITLGSQGNSFRKVKYDRSELRFIEVFHEPPLCNRMLKYKLHKERKGCSRFDKTIPETQKSLSSLTEKGVKVYMDIPLEMWDKPTVEVVSLVKQCDSILSAYEGDLEDWFYNLQNEVTVLDYLCRDRVLKDLPQGEHDFV